MKRVLDNLKAGWPKFALAWAAVIWFYLTLYLSGVVTTQQGLLIALAALFSCTMATVLTPWLEVRHAAEPSQDAGRRTQDAGRRTQDAGRRTQDALRKRRVWAAI